MGRNKQVDIQGQTMFAVNGGAFMMHTEHTIIGQSAVTATIAGIGPGCEPVDPVSSDDPAVVEYERAKLTAREISAYRNRPVTPIFKTARKSRRRRHDGS